MINYHLHHIVPKHAGGTDDPSNLVKVNKAMHAFMHRLRYLETGDYYDCCAANLLSGDWTAEQARQEACRHGQQQSEKFLPAVTKTIQEYNSRPFEKRSNQARINGLKKPREARVEDGKRLGSMLYWNNGLNNKRSHTCPGEGYVLGKLPHGRINRTYKQCPHCELMVSSNNLTRHVLAKHT